MDNIKYDTCFRQAVARDKTRSIPWDHLKKDLLVWCATRQPFCAFKPSGQGLNTARQTPTAPGAPHSGARTLHVASGQEICRRYNFGNCARADCKFAHTCWTVGCGGDTPGNPAPGLPQLHLAEKRVCTPLQCSQFKSELASHHDKAWVSWLLNGITYGVSIGLSGPHTPYVSSNLPSTAQHPHIITAELAKEVEAGRVLGPLWYHPYEYIQVLRSGGYLEKERQMDDPTSFSPIWIQRQ